MEAFNLANIAQSNFKVLLDNQVTTHCFSERALLRSVRGGPAHMRIKTNGGTVVTKTIGTFDQLELTDEVWHLPTGIANILSHSKLCATSVCSPAARTRPSRQRPRQLVFHEPGHRTPDHLPQLDGAASPSGRHRPSPFFGWARRGETPSVRPRDRETSHEWRRRRTGHRFRFPAFRLSARLSALAGRHFKSFRHATMVVLEVGRILRS